LPTRRVTLHAGVARVADIRLEPDNVLTPIVKGQDEPDQELQHGTTSPFLAGLRKPPMVDMPFHKRVQLQACGMLNWILRLTRFAGILLISHLSDSDDVCSDGHGMVVIAQITLSVSWCAICTATC